jgi:hypothetical protein|tara:strand:- start:914 stop:1591 length:678 start_codon:yes stop_codon:yes gene_type:complete
MELQEQTLNVLKNFSDINPNILIKEGSTIKTISEAKNVLATAIVDNEFTQQFGIYDLKEFIGVLSLVDQPSLKFADESVTVSDQSGRSKIRYFFSPEETLTSPQKDINMPECEVQFVLDNDTLNKLRSAATALGHTEVSVTPGDGVLTLSVVDNENATSNAYSIDVPYTSKPDTPFTFVINIGNLKIIPGDYEVSISSKLISEFKNKEVNVRYWIALEKTSTFGV